MASSGCGRCSTCLKEGNKYACIVRKTEKNFLSENFAYQPWSPTEEDLLPANALKFIQRTLDLTEPPNAEPPNIHFSKNRSRWSLSSIFAFLKGVSHANASARIGFFRRCWPRLDLHKCRNDSARSWSLQGNAEAVVILCFWALDGASSNDKDDVRLQVTRRLLVYLGADHSILDEFYARSGVFSEISAWAYNLQTDASSERADYDGEQSENEEDATPEGKSFEDQMRDILTESASEVIEMVAASAKEGSPDLYCCRCPEGVLKVGYSQRTPKRDVKDRLKELEENFQWPHVLRALWKNAGHLETAVLASLREHKTDVQGSRGSTSREHFCCSLGVVIDAVNKADFDAVQSASHPASRKRSHAELDDATEAAKLEYNTAMYVARMKHAERSESLLLELVAQKEPSALKMFFARLEGTQNKEERRT